MTVFSPELAAAYVRELTWEARAVSVRGPGGALLAGDESGAGGDVVRASLGVHEIAVAVGRGNLRALIEYDAEHALRAVLSPGEDR
jgi:hypothetical protein